MKKKYLKSDYLAEGISGVIEGINDEWFIYAITDGGKINCKLFSYMFDTEKFVWGVTTSWYQLGVLAKYIWDGRHYGGYNEKKKDYWVFEAALKKSVKAQLEDDGFEVRRRK